MRTNGQKKKAKRRPALPRSQNLTSQRCQFCGCTDAKACAGGCAWADGRAWRNHPTCTRCAVTFHTGELSAFNAVIDELLDTANPLIPVLKDACAQREEAIAGIVQRVPQALLDDLAQHPDHPAQEFGKGVRSSDRMEQAAGAAQC